MGQGGVLRSPVGRQDFEFSLPNAALRAAAKRGNHLLGSI